MTETQIVNIGSATLAQYGNRDVIKEIAARLKKFLPNGDTMSEDDALGFAQTALALDLNPFAHEVWYVPGMGIVTGIAGYRKMARAQGKFIAETREMTAEEREKHNLKDGEIGAICELYRPDQIMDAVKVNEAAGKIVIPIEPTIGVGVKRPTERNKYAPQGRTMMWVAEKRAEADALRKAFDLTLPFRENGGQHRAAQPAIIEGEVIEEPEAQLSGWAVEALQDEAEAPAPEEIAKKRAMLYGDDDDGEPKPPPTLADAADNDDWPDPPLDDEPRPGLTCQRCNQHFVSVEKAAYHKCPTPAGSQPVEATQPPEPPAAPFDLPTDFAAFAAVAIQKLGYRSNEHVRQTLRDQGIERICTPLGVLEFDPHDGWALLKDEAPQPKPQQGTLV
jgi:hypothetical protein